MRDTALEDFMSRFGEIETEAPRPQLNSVSSLDSGGVKLAEFAKPTADLSNMESDINKNIAKQAKPAKTGSGLPDGTGDLISGGMGLVQSFSGTGLNTDAETGGPGKAGAHILGGASAGMQAGSIAGPWGMAIGAAVGAGGSALAHNAAKKEYLENVRNKNLNDVALTEKENRDDYRMSRGLSSIADSKELLKNQLNIIS